MSLDILKVVAIKIAIMLISTIYIVPPAASFPPMNPLLHGRLVSDVHQETVCADPDDLQTRYEGYNTGNEILLSLAREAEPVTEKQREDIFLPPRIDTCPFTRNERRSFDPEKRAICPVEWRYNTSMTRYPRSIPYARCRCSDCRGIPSMAGGCEISWYNVVVLRTNGNCINGKRVYYPSNEPVPAACFCALKIHRYT